MEISERSFLLEGSSYNRDRSFLAAGLSVTFAVICIVDVFGVFPVVSLPKPIIDCGYAGIIVVVLVCGTQIYTAVLLGKCWLMAGDIEPNLQFKNRYPYSALAEITYGNVLSKFVTFLLDLTIFGGGIPNLIVASQNLQFLGLRLSANSFDMSFCSWMIILGTVMCPFLWLGSPRDMKVLCTVSVTLVLCLFVLVLSCAVLDTNANDDATLEILPPSKINFSLWQNVLNAYGILVFQFDIHPTVLTIQVDMNDGSKIDKAIIGGFFVSLSLFFVTCVTIFSRYGSNVNSSILEMFPNSVSLHCAAFLVALQLSLSTAISNTALYQHIEDSMGIPRDFSHKRCIIRSALAILSVLMAESVPRFDLVMSLIGGALTGPLVFILPPLFYIKMLFLKRRHEKSVQLESFNNIVYNAGDFSKTVSGNMETSFNKECGVNIILHNSRYPTTLRTSLEIIFCSILVILGFLTTVATTYLNIQNTLQYISFSPPCIVNFYNATISSV